MDEHNDITKHDKILKELNKLEEKLSLIVRFYEELGVLRMKRKNAIDNFEQRVNIENDFWLHFNAITNDSELSDENLTKSAGVTFASLGNLSEATRPTRSGSHLDKKKSIAKWYEILDRLSAYHEEVNKKISELEILKKEKTVPGVMDIDKALEQLRVEKDEIHDQIIEYVIKNVVEGKEQLFNVISTIELENKMLEDIIIFLEKRVGFLKDAVSGLLKENKHLKKGNNIQPDTIRDSLTDNISIMFPKQLRANDIIEPWEMVPPDYEDLPFQPEQEDIPSVEDSNRDSFELDAAMAFWHTDQAALREHVKRIGQNLEVMEMNQMRLNMLKSYVQRHGAKYINTNTLIDPRKGMSLWHT